MRIAMIGTGYVGLVSAPASRISAITSPASTRTPPRSKALREGEIPIYEPGLDRSGRAPTSREGRLDLHHRPRAAGGRGRRRVHRGRHAVAPRRRPCGPVLCATPPRARSPPRSTASPSSSLNRPCRSAPATKSSASSRRRARTPTSRSSRTRNFCAKAPPSRISSIPTASSSAPTTTRARRSWPSSIGRFI